jgi:hypothetical protein
VVGACGNDAGTSHRDVPVLFPQTISRLAPENRVLDRVPTPAGRKLVS